MKRSNIIFGHPKKIENYNSAVLFYDSSLTRYKNQWIKASGCKNVIEIPVAASETSKNISKVASIYKTLSKNSVDKKTVLVALGGGVVGDIAGFVASTYLRGLPYISIPTTVLSQVDSSLGGKNGVNLDTGKNLIGTFYQPDEIVIDHSYLKSLPDREVISGLGEIFKYSLLDKNIKFPEFEKKSFKKQQLLKTIKKLTPKCVALKMKLVKKDEHDEKGIRQVLNLGHTFAHVLEARTSYRTYKHGEAVVWGLKFTAIVSYLKGHMTFVNFREIMNIANRFQIPALPRNLDPLVCYKIALKDKKSYNQKVKMVLLEKFGKPLANKTVTKEEFLEAVNLLKDFS